MSFIWVFPLVILSIIGTFIGLWLWTQYLESGKPSQIRNLLLIGLSFIVIIEFYVWSTGFYYSSSWTFGILLVCDMLGMCDAILRYPVVHDLDSLFSLKQLLLLGIKTCAHALGWRNVGKTATTFLVCICLCCWSIPLGYLMALPIGDTRAQIGSQRAEVRDYDISFKIYYVCGSIIFGKTHPDFREGAAIREELLHSARINVCWVTQIMGDYVPGAQGFFVKMGALDQRTVNRRSGKEI